MAPLQAATAEADLIAAFYTSAQQLTGGAATVRAFTERALAADVIHFGGHGIVSGGAAALVFAPESGDSGRMDLRALSRLRLTRTSVVVVAACDTARGAARAGEGTVSIAYAFLQAGAPAVIATLWPISDESAAAFFPRLHRHLANGVRAAEALRLAQLESIADGTGDRSDLWGAVQCIGD
jgi:CHAT domain-containing protein